MDNKKHIRMISDGGWKRAALVCAVVLAFPFVLNAQEPAPLVETMEQSDNITQNADSEIGALGEESDAQAIAFAQKCMGCHTIGGGALSGPDLKPSTGWPVANLRDAVVRMEKNVGPMTPEEVDAFTQFLLSADALERLKKEQERAALRQIAQMEPGNAETGRELFMGVRHFSKGGLACASCHQAGGKGGNLAVSLEDAFTRLGETPLVSACEKPGFKVMKTIYAESPLTKQEALHVVKFLESVSTEARSAATVPTHLVGIIGAFALMVLMGRSTSKRAAGTRARLVAEAHRKSNLGGGGR